LSRTRASQYCRYAEDELDDEEDRVMDEDDEPPYRRDAEKE
jgi:hypothetical protein